MSPNGFDEAEEEEEAWFGFLLVKIAWERLPVKSIRGYVGHLYPLGELGPVASVSLKGMCGGPCLRVSCRLTEGFEVHSKYS